METYNLLAWCGYQASVDANPLAIGAPPRGAPSAAGDHHVRGMKESSLVESTNERGREIKESFFYKLN